MNHSYRHDTDERQRNANYGKLHRAHGTACGSKQAQLQSTQLRATYERQHRKTKGKKGQNTTRRGALCRRRPGCTGMATGNVLGRAQPQGGPRVQWGPFYYP